MTPPGATHRHTQPVASHPPHAADPFTALVAEAMAGHETTAPRAASIPDRSGRPPWLVDTAATAALRPGRWSVQQPAKAAVSWRGAGTNSGRSATPPAAVVRRPRPGTAWGWGGQGCRARGGGARPQPLEHDAQPDQCNQRERVEGKQRLPWHHSLI